MNKLIVDTKGIDGIVSSIDSDIQNYKLAVDNFFKEIEKLSDYWKGVDSEQFISKVLKEKTNLDDLGLILSEYNQALKNVKDKIENYYYFQE